MLNWTRYAEFNWIHFLYHPTGGVKVDVLIQNETVWLTQKRMAELFNVQIPAISKHLANIFVEGELY